MTHTLHKEAPALIIDVGLGVVGFILSIILGKVANAKMTRSTVRVLAAVWAGIAIFGMTLAFIM